MPRRKPIDPKRKKELKEGAEIGFKKVTSHRPIPEKTIEMVRSYVHKNLDVYERAVGESDKLLRLYPGPTEGRQFQEDVHAVALGMMLAGLEIPEGKVGIYMQLNSEIHIKRIKGGGMEFQLVPRSKHGPETN